MAKRILLIGAGLTASLIANILKRSRANNTLRIPIELHIWEKSRGVGGRFSTSRNPKNPDCTADLGAQYLTRNISNILSRPYFDSLIENGLISKFATNDIPGFQKSTEDDRENYVCIAGTGSVVKHFLNEADVKDIVFNKRVVSMQVSEDGRVKVVPEDQNQSEMFDVVVSTIPVPQILQLGNIDNILEGSDNPELKNQLARVSYTSRYALGLFYNEKLNVATSESSINFVNDPVIRYWSLEDEKRQLGRSDSSRDSNSAAVVHTSVTFGAENIDKNSDEIKKQLLTNVKETCKTLEGKIPDFVKCHKWRYSQVYQGFEGAPGFVTLSETPLIIAAGDGFVQSGFENCVLSSERTAQYLISMMQ